MVEHLLIAWQRWVFTCRAGEARMTCRQIPSDRRLVTMRYPVETIQPECPTLAHPNDGVVAVRVTGTVHREQSA
jgi:hypothetical protein